MRPVEIRRKRTLNGSSHWIAIRSRRPWSANFGSFLPFPGGTTMIDPPDGTVEVENPSEALRSEDGVFDVTSPYGYVFQVKCRRGSKMSVRPISEPKYAGESGRMTWRIRRLNRAVA